MPLALQSNLRALSVRGGIGDYLNAQGLTGKAVEVGTLYGAFAAEVLSTWKGQLFCIDPWRNQDDAVYFDGANKEDMEHIFAAAYNGVGRHPRCTLLRCMSLNGVGLFDDGELDWVFLDGNHATPAVRDDISAWWPKVKIGGVISGHDFFTRYDNDTNSDALTAVMELAEILGVMPHVTWCTSWWFIKTEEADKKFKRACMDGTWSRPVYTFNIALELITVMPVARFDWNLAKKNLAWIRASGCDEKIIAYVTHELTLEQQNALSEYAQVVVADHLKELGYFGSPNQVIKGALEYCEQNYPGYAMLWCEADAVPMRGTWIQEIGDEYRACGRPFMGDVYRGPGAIPHLTGNSVYNPNWRKLAPSLAALGTEQCGWDTLCAHETLPRSHKAKTIQQIWRPRLPITESFLADEIRPEAALFHQVKDGSLIDLLCAKAGLPIIPLEPALCKSTYDTQKTNLPPEVQPIMGSVPTVSHLRGRVRALAAQVRSAPSGTGPVEILIVTFKRDIEFLKYCLKSIEKYARGFAGVTLAVPESERGLYDWVKHVKMVYFPETPGKGMLHHEIMVCRADELCPNASAILHMDADCMFWANATPSDFFIDGKPVILRERYVSLRNPNRKLWQRCVENAVGFKPEYETMVAHPQIRMRAVYKATRDLVERYTKKPFNEYVLSCNNEFPQSFAEHMTTGAVAIAHFRDQHACVDYDWRRDADECGLSQDAGFQYLYRRDRDKVVETWSHAGIGRYKSDMEAWLNGRVPQYVLK